MLRQSAIASIFCFVSLFEMGDSYRILGVFPTPSISHQVVFRAVTLALNERGHELVIVTPDPIKNPTLRNYTEIDISFTYKTSVGANFIAHRRANVKWCEFFRMNDTRHRLTEDVLGHPDVRKLYALNSNEKFDLLLAEVSFFPGVLSLANRFDVPVVGITSFGLTTDFQHAIGNHMTSSHHSNWELQARLSTQPSFWQRLGNFVTIWQHMYWLRTTYKPMQQAIARKYLGNNIPDLSELEQNVSLVFVNQPIPISYSKPNVPNVIEIGGFHLSKNTVTLPKSLQRILDEATEGFVYMSLGSNVKSTVLPNKTRNEFIAAFSRLPYKVLWKFEENILPNKPDNVHIMKWVPQQAVLAHPNLKVFVYQGGLQSTEEAVAHAVPLVGLPIFADQDMQVDKMVSLGVAVKLEITTLTENELSEAIRTIANDQGYKQRMENLRSLMNDKPYDSLENAVWWTEYVIRHKGAPHLRSSTVDEPWYSRQDMDIVAFISVTSTIILCLTFLLVNRLFKIIYDCSTQYCDAKTKIN